MSRRATKQKPRPQELDESQFGPASDLAVAKLKPDPIAFLADKGAITRDQERAALRIAQAVRTIASGTLARVASYEGGIRGTPTAVATEAQIANEMRFNAWADAMDDRRWPIGPVLDIAVDGIGVRELERKWRKAHGTMLQRISDALDLFWSTKIKLTRGQVTL